MYGSGIGLGSSDTNPRMRDQMERGMEDGMTTGTICWLQRLGFWSNMGGRSKGPSGKGKHTGHHFPYQPCG